jgi:hypothetical protein
VAPYAGSPFRVWNFLVDVHTRPTREQVVE